MFLPITSARRLPTTGRRDHPEAIRIPTIASIHDINPDYPIEIEPRVTEGIVSRPHPRQQEMSLSIARTREFAAWLQKDEASARLFESSLQGLCKNKDGTLLVSSFGAIQSFIDLLDAQKSWIKSLSDSLRQWRDDGANEVVFHFADGRHPRAA